MKDFFALRDAFKSSVDDVISYAKQGKFLVVANVIIAVFTFVSVLLLARLLSTDAFGEYRFFLAVIATLSIFSLTGTSTVVMQHAARGDTGAYRRTIPARMLWSTLGAIGLLIAAGYFWWRADVQWYLYALIALTFPILYSFDAAIYNCFGLGKVGTASIIKAVVNIVPAAFTVLVAYYTRSASAVVIAYVFSLALIWLAVHLFMRRGVAKTEQKKDDISLRSYIRHLSFLDAFSLIYGQIDNIIVTSLAGFSSLAVYAIAQTIPDAIKTQTKVLYAVVLPSYSKNPPRNFASVWRSTLTTLILSGALIALLWLILPFVIPILFGIKYAAAVPYTQWLLFTTFFWMPSLVLLAYLQATSKITEQYAYRIATPIVGTVLYLLAIPLFGIWGAIGAAILTETISFIALAILVWRTFRGRKYPV